MQDSRLKMSSQCFLINQIGNVVESKNVPSSKLCYEEKCVGTTSFYKCEACPYMALAEDDIKYHLFTVHPELAKNIGLADVSIPCPGCSEIFEAVNPLRSHLREHHKMGVRDIRKMVKSLVLIALKSAPSEKAENTIARSPAPIVITPEVIEVPDLVQTNNVTAPGSITVISMEELQKMSTINIEHVDPKDIIQDASIEIVYSDEPPSNSASEDTINVAPLQNTTPDLISSVQSHGAPNISEYSPASSSSNKTDSVKESAKISSNDESDIKKTKMKCKVLNCGVSLISEEKMAYHTSCHQKAKLQCPECKRFYVYVKELHTHLWKEHEIDMELHSCNICGYKTYSLSRLNNIHRKIHETVKSVPCPLCGKLFKSLHQMNTHKVLHNEMSYSCNVCLKRFSTEKRLRVHFEAVHEKKKPFRCCQCDYSTARKCSLNLHIKIHTGESLKCDKCEFSAVDRNSMRRHKQQHTDQKKYKCKHCSYTSIQSQTYLKHMLHQHPGVQSDDVFTCPYCKYMTVNQSKLLSHMVIHKEEKEEVQRYIIDMTQKQKSWNKPKEDTLKSWNTPTENDPIPAWNARESPTKTNWSNPAQNDQMATWNTLAENEHCEQPVKSDTPVSTQDISHNDSENPTNLTVPIEVDDCDSEQDPSHYTVDYGYITNSAMAQDKAYHMQEMLTNFNKDDNNSDCIISESSNDTVNDRHQCFSQHSLDSAGELHNSNLREFLGGNVTIANNLLQNTNENVITSNAFGSNSMSTSIMNNLPIYLPPNPPRLSIRRNLTLAPSDKIPLPVPKVTGPIITPTQILPVPSTSSSPISMTNHSNQSQPTEIDGAPRKKAKISVKSNLILKGPDQVNIFNSEQNMVFARLQDSERLNLSSPVTFNNLITTCMQLPPEPVLTRTPENDLSTIPPYTPEPMLGDPTIVPIKDNRLYTFNRQIDLNSISMLSQHMSQNKMSIICGNPSFIKLESKQNIQSPGLERMCNAGMMNSKEMPDVYCKSSPLPDEMQKNVNEIKNEIKTDTFYNMTVNSSQSSPDVMDHRIMDTIISVNEMYGNHLDLSMPLQEITEDDQLPDIIEIDDNSEDNKLLPQRFNMAYPMDYIHNDFYFLENELNPPCSAGKTVPAGLDEGSILPTEVPLPSKESGSFSENKIPNYDIFIHSKKDPMMNTSVRPSVHKINVKNIELMKN